jgi:hypothetical protein
MRLEQRIGRVDRIGQTRTVHAFHFIGGDSGELQLLEELRTRIAHAQSAIGAPDPLDGALDADAVEPIRSDEADVGGELLRLRLARLLHEKASGDDRPLMATIRNRHTRGRLGRRGLFLWECTIADGRDRIVSSQLVAATVDPGATSGEASDGRCADAIAQYASSWRDEAAAHARRFAHTGIARAGAIAGAIERDGMAASQPGLFDRRAQFADLAKKAAQDEALSAQAERRAELRLSADLTMTAPRLRLLLVPPR